MSHAFDDNPYPTCPQVGHDDNRAASHLRLRTSAPDDRPRLAAALAPLASLCADSVARLDATVGALHFDAACVVGALVRRREHFADLLGRECRRLDPDHVTVVALPDASSLGGLRAVREHIRRSAREVAATVAPLTLPERTDALLRYIQRELERDCDLLTDLP